MASSQSQVFIYDTVDGDVHTFYVSPLPDTHGLTTGLPSEAIMGSLKDGPERIVPESFITNKLFSRYLASVIAKHANSCPGLLAEARRQQNGHVVVIDNRTATPDGRVPPEDIIGVFEVNDGKLLRFHASPNHQLLTTNGFMRLEAFMNDRLVEELLVLSRTEEGIQGK